MLAALTSQASQKTLAFGLPLIKTIFEGSSCPRVTVCDACDLLAVRAFPSDANLAYFCAPIMRLHPMQLTLVCTAIRLWNDRGWCKHKPAVAGSECFK